MVREVRDWWEATADYFQDELDLPVGVNWTGFYQPEPTLLEDVEGADALELGCGGGQCSVALAQRGASVTGVDLSRRQLDHARELADEHDGSVEFVEGDVTDLGFLADESIDVAFNSFVFQWIGDLDACFEHTRRVLRPDGRFVFSMPHPCYDLVDPETGRVEGSYFDTGRDVTHYDEVDVPQVTYRHTVSGVHNALVEAGFRVERLLEPGSADPDEYEAGPWGEYTPALMSRLPPTIVFDARPD